MSGPEVVAATLAVLTLLALLAGVARAVGRFLRKISHFIDDITGETERPGVPARPGVVEQVSELRKRQEEIGAVAEQAADDVATVRSELTRNGGSSTKDAAHRAERSAESAATDARIASQAALRTEDLMRRHMENGLEIMAVGVHNDQRLYEALKAHGIDIEDLREYPPVDTGD